MSEKVRVWLVILAACLCLPAAADDRKRGSQFGSPFICSVMFSFRLDC